MDQGPQTKVLQEARSPERNGFKPEALCQECIIERVDNEFTSSHKGETMACESKDGTINANLAKMVIAVNESHDGVAEQSPLKDIAPF